LFTFIITELLATRDSGYDQIGGIVHEPFWSSSPVSIAVFRQILFLQGKAISGWCNDSIPGMNNFVK
jgi:hypothetical protein